MTRIILQEAERMRVMVALGEAERHITDEQSSDRHRRIRHMINICQGIFGSGPTASHNVMAALARVRDSLHLLECRPDQEVTAAGTDVSLNLVAAANSLQGVESLLISYLDGEFPVARDAALKPAAAARLCRLVRR